MRLALLGSFRHDRTRTNRTTPIMFFVEKYPTTKEYTDRLAEEVELISKHRFLKHFVRVHPNIRASKDFSHITRGSAGCSPVCFSNGYR